MRGSEAKSIACTQEGFDYHISDYCTSNESVRAEVVDKDRAIRGFRVFVRNRQAEAWEQGFAAGHGDGGSGTNPYMGEES